MFLQKYVGSRVDVCFQVAESMRKLEETKQLHLQLKRASQLSLKTCSGYKEDGGKQLYESEDDEQCGEGREEMRRWV